MLQLQPLYVTKKATVFIDDISLANYGFNFYRADHSTVQMQSGENTLMFLER